ncbi:binding partner of ACD11 1 [Selaginella moellendorffii]|uniref:binding partner of ACD11 1 n=1 Tax=Selaginella moellendorffii TaxID=88036 RepID=UPI000D1CF62C|nr:binding partner of ACD11 1 [Selaginella moellendorffii]|eukprot:XP_024524197.1 binding partner of ACD11 1 [Selaginella moellendorffii]
MANNTVRVTNLSIRATQQDILNFFSFSGEIQNVELERDGEASQVAHVTFKDPDAVDTALLLSGATIVDQSVLIAPVEDWTPSNQVAGSSVPENKAQAVITTMLAKGFVLGKDAMGKAKAFDDKHRFTASATATMADIDKKIGFREKINAGTAAVNQGVRAVDQKFQVSEKTKTAFTAAEQKMSSAGSALMKNKYIFTGASWVTGAFNKVAKAANDVSQKTKEKVEKEEQVGGIKRQPSGDSTPRTAELFPDEAMPQAHHV